MFKNVNEYLEQLKTELKGSDSALIQDALFDAEEHLRTALEEKIKSTPDISEAEAFQSLVEKYGTPSEVASAYRGIESRISPVLARPKKPDTRSFIARFFGVLAEPRAWGAFFYMAFSILTGCIYSIYAFTGASLSLCTLILIIGLPITGLFLLSIRGIALLEGRIVEALLGVRMPRKPLFMDKGQSWTEKFKALITESHTWKALAYTLLHFPLGLLFFFVTVGMFAFSISFITAPLFELVFHLPLELFGEDAFTPVWLLPFVSIVGFFLLPLTFHFAKLIGKLHGRYAKYMLVRKLPVPAMKHSEAG